MTREEAIRWLEDIHRRFNPTRENLENEGGDVHLQALDMAIEALKAKTDGDLISRQDALKPFCIAPDGTRIPEVDCDNFPVEFSVEFIKKHLLSLPSAEPKTGEWDICKDDGGVYGVCSICGCYVDFSLYGRPYKVCPHCEARMIGKDGEE